MATIQENFHEWKNWTLKHNTTPKRHSEDKEEDRLAGRMSTIISRLRKNDSSNHILTEYEAICKVYRKGHILQGRKRSIFNEWKEWCALNNRVPSALSENEEEARLAVAISRSIKRLITKDSTNHIVKEYYKLRNYYRLIAKVERRMAFLKKFKLWCEKNGRMPDYKSGDEIEKRLAINIRNIYYIAIKTPDIHREFLEAYQKIMAEYK